MKTLKTTLIITVMLIFLYAVVGMFLNLSIKRIIGKFIIGNNNTYLVLTHYDEFRDFDNLYFDFYKNDSLIIKQKYFDSTDGEPQTSDIKVRNFNGLYYVTYFDSTKIKILCDREYNIIFPIDYGGLKDDSIAKLPFIKKMLKVNNLTLGRF